MQPHFSEGIKVMSTATIEKDQAEQAIDTSSGTAGHQTEQMRRFLNIHIRNAYHSIGECKQIYEFMKHDDTVSKLERLAEAIYEIQCELEFPVGKVGEMDDQYPFE